MIDMEKQEQDEKLKSDPIFIRFSEGGDQVTIYQDFGQQAYEMGTWVLERIVTHRKIAGKEKDQKIS